MRPVSVIGLGSYLPGDPVSAEFFAQPADPLANSPLFRIPRLRHHVSPGERAASMIAAAALPMFSRLGIAPAADILITNVLLPDQLFTGCGAETAALLGWTPDWIIDLHNGGCASFPYMIKLARTLIAGGAAQTALIANVQNTAGQIFTQPEIRTRSHASVAGDGCGVAYLRVGDEAPILGAEIRNIPAFARDLGPSTSDGRRYWEPGSGQLDVKFDESKGAEIIARGNSLVPELVTELCKRIDLSIEDIDVLITNQPNRIFLRTWREALGVPADRHVDTFDLFGNLYGAGAPVTFHHAVEAGRVRQGDLVVLAGFAHAGDFAAATAIQWGTGGSL